VSRIVQLAARTGAPGGAPVLPYVGVLGVLALVAVVTMLVTTSTGRRLALPVIARLRDAVVPRRPDPDPDRILPAARMAIEDAGSPYATGPIAVSTMSSSAVTSDATNSGAITMGNVATVPGTDHENEAVPTAPWWAHRAVSVLPGRPLPRKARDDSAAVGSHRDEPTMETMDGSGSELDGADTSRDDGWPPAPEPLRGSLSRGRSLPADATPLTSSPATSAALEPSALKPAPLKPAPLKPAPLKPAPAGQPVLGTPPMMNAVPSFELGPIRAAASADPAKPRRTATKKQQALLVEVGEQLASQSEQHAVADLTARSAIALVGADNAILVLKSISGPQVLAQSPDAQHGAAVWGVRTLGALLMRPEPVRLMIDGDPLVDGARTAVLTAPIISGGDLVGVLVSRRLSAKAFTAYDEAALSRLAQACGSRLTSSPERELLVASHMDRVTGLANRELLLNDLFAALTGMVAHGMPATLLVGEVDGLARLRTTKGSVAADVALAELAAKVRVAVRFADAVYRSGGDELAVLLPATDEAGAAAVGQRLTALAAGSFETTHPGLSLRTAAVDVYGSAKDVFARAAADLAAARIAERWAAGTKVV
jgi:diguanylate cyclase (GGDEF)-like protein